MKGRKLKTLSSAEYAERERKRANDARRFPTNTCPASRHVQMIGEALAEGKRYPMLREEPAHCAGSMLSTVASLYETRTKLAKAKEALEKISVLAEGDTKMHRQTIRNVVRDVMEELE